MFAAPVSEIASPTLMSAFGPVDTLGDGPPAVPPPHAPTSSETAANAAARRTFIAHLHACRADASEGRALRRMLFGSPPGPDRRQARGWYCRERPRQARDAGSPDRGAATTVRWRCRRIRPRR